jgi:hypothetical protein
VDGQPFGVSSRSDSATGTELTIWGEGGFVDFVDSEMG